MWKRSSSVIIGRRQQLLSGCDKATRRQLSLLANQMNTDGSDDRPGLIQKEQLQQRKNLSSSCTMTWSLTSHNKNNSNRNIGQRQLRSHVVVDKNSFSTINSSSSSSNSGSSMRRKDGGFMVVGSGVAGCSAALIAAERYGIPVTLVYAGDVPTDCNSYWAQGGIIYRNYDPASNDSAESLVEDVHRAGAGLCVDEAVWKLALDGPERVRELLLDPSGVFANVPFDRKPDGDLSCCLEASHAAPRIIHKADHTGKAITDHITAAALRHPLITIVSNSIVTDLITTTTTDNHTGDQQQKACLGAMVMDKRTGEISSIMAPYGTLLASGGLGGIYQHSTNPVGFNALGSSVALATRAGAHTSDLEYVQFHPTALYIPNENRYLLTEALRGEGAKLRDASGRKFAKDFHPDGELAPRDIVARGVFNQLALEPNHHNVFLDISHRDSDWLRSRFPSIDKHLLQRGLDITKDALPITPAAHYTCGGITTDLNGCTNILGLYSAGEAARTGLHGGNRLASTSLLEGIVYGATVADHIGTNRHSLLDMSNELNNNQQTEITEDYNRLSSSMSKNKHAAVVERSQDLLQHLRKVMWDHVGVVRTPRGLSQAATELSYIHEEAVSLFENTPCMHTAGLRDATMAGQAVTMAALSNRVSAGAHCIVLDEADLPTASALEEELYDDDSDDDDVVVATVTN